jgi:uncharacterized protein YjbI with pentapeptide repeats
VANAEHLDLFRQGVEVWNAWRAKDLSVLPDLTEAHLSGTDLREANLTKANLTKADLSGADLERAALRWANLSQANLKRARLTYADLYWVRRSSQQVNRKLQTRLPSNLRR